MSSYNPPTENLPTFNSSLFNQPIVALSQAEADLLYLSKTKNDTSTATLTTFNNAIALKNNHYKIYEALDFTASPNYTITLPFAQTYTIRSAFTSIIITLPIITNEDNGIIINLVKVQGSSNISAQINNGTGIGTNTIYTQNDLAGGTHQNTTLLALNKMSTTLMATTAGSFPYWLEIGGASTYDIAQNNLIYPRLTTDNNFTNRLNFSASSYSFPFASSQSLGYYLKTTTSPAVSVTSAIPKTILTTASIPIGVWRIDFSVQNVVGVAGAGTITQAQSYISPTSDGNVGTAVPFTGSIIRSQISEVYGNDDVQVITSSLTYQQTTAGVLRLNIVRTFATGSYTFTGEIGLTRIA